MKSKVIGPERVDGDKDNPSDFLLACTTDRQEQGQNDRNEFENSQTSNPDLTGTAWCPGGVKKFTGPVAGLWHIRLEADAR